MNSAYKKILFISLATFLVSFSYALYYHDRPRVDAQAYDQIGWNLSRGLGYVEDPIQSATPELDWGIIRLGPGYQFFLAGIYYIFGHTYWIVWLLQAILRALTVILLFFTAKKLFPESDKVAFFSALFFAISPDLILISGLLLTETLFLALCIGAVYLTLLFLERKDTRLAFFAGFLWALAILTRPTALLPLAALVVYMAVIRRPKFFIALLVAPIIIIGSWSYFATQRYGFFILTTGVGGYDLWVGNHLGATGGFEKNNEILAIRHTASIAELDRTAKRNYFSFLTSHPLDFIGLQIKKTALYFSALRPGGSAIHLWGRPLDRFITLGASFIWTLVAFLFGIAGSVKFAIKKKDLVHRFFLAFAVLQPIAVIPIIVEPRYRYPLFPFLIIFAAYYLFQKPCSKKIFLFALCALVLFTSYDLIMNFSEIYEKAKIVFAL